MNAQVDSLPTTTAPSQRAMARVGNQFLPQSFGELIKYAEYVAASELVPKDYRGKPANVAVAVQWGMELGLSPLQALQNIAVINGRPSLWGDLVVALVQAHPDFVDMSDVEHKDAAGNVTGYTVTLKRKGRTPTVRSFNKSDAEKAGLWGKQGPWQTGPARMLMIRARTFAIRDTFADALRGIAIREEMEDVIDVAPGDFREVPAQPSAPVVALPRAKSEATKQPEAPAPEPQASGEGTGAPAAGTEQAPAAEVGEPGIHGLSDSQQRILAARADAAGLDLAAVCAQFPRIDLSNLNDVLNWLRSQAEGKAA